MKVCSVEVPRTMYTEFPAIVMVLWIVSNGEHVMPLLCFFTQGIRVNSTAYTDIQGSTMYATEDLMCFNSTQCHNRRLQQLSTWMAKLFHNHSLPNIWPPSSPNVNAFNYNIWKVVEKGFNERPHSTTESLRVFTVRIMSNMNRDHLILACSRSTLRIEGVIEDEGIIIGKKWLNNVYFYAQRLCFIEFVIYCGWLCLLSFRAQ